MTTGLRRFREPPAPRAPSAPSGPAGPERCEMCAAPLHEDRGAQHREQHGEQHREQHGEEHGHVVDLETRALMCVCPGCRLLFVRPGQGRYRAVPARYLYVPSFAISPADWDELGIPVRTAFFFRNSSLGRTVAFYPSPAGATESLLPLATWDHVLEANPAPADVEPDVEALLVDRAPDGSFSCHLVPIDACYRLVGLVRLHWKGFDGGREAWEAIDAFFAALRRRARVLKEV